MKWLPNLLDRFLDRIAPLPDFTGTDWLSDEILYPSADAPTHSESDTARVSGVPTGSPDLWVTPAGDDQAVVPGGFVTDEQRIQELLADYESFLRNLFRS